MVLELRNITVHYGKKEVLHGVSLAVAKDSMVTLIGPNGAGKTTLLRAVSGMIAPSSGEVWFNGNRADKQATEKLVKSGMVHIPAGRGIFPRMSVLENLLVGAHVRKDNKEVETELRQVFDEFPALSERRKKMASTLSGGEQQMLAFARGLLAKPRLLLMDEPSMGLAPLIVQEIYQIIRDIKERGVSVLLVEQNARLALSLADKAYVLENGRIVLQGNAEELKHDSHVIEAYLGT